MDEENSKLVWNFDNAESQLIFNMKLDFINKRNAWDLEGEFWSLYNLLSETEALLDDTDREKMKGDFDNITTFRKEHPFSENMSDGDKSEAFVLLNNFYRDLCLKIVDKDLYFRKKKEYLGL